MSNHNFRSQARPLSYIMHHLEEDITVHVIMWIRMLKTDSGSESHKKPSTSVSSVILYLDQVTHTSGLVWWWQYQSARELYSSKAISSFNEITHEIGYRRTRPVHNTRKREADSCIDDVDDILLTKNDIQDIVKAVMDAIPSSSSCQPLGKVESDVMLG